MGNNKSGNHQRSNEDEDLGLSSQNYEAYASALTPEERHEISTGGGFLVRNNVEIAAANTSDYGEAIITEIPEVFTDISSDSRECSTPPIITETPIVRTSVSSESATETIEKAAPFTIETVTIETVASIQNTPLGTTVANTSRNVNTLASQKLPICEIGIESNSIVKSRKLPIEVIRHPTYSLSRSGGPTTYMFM